MGSCVSKEDGSPSNQDKVKRTSKLDNSSSSLNEKDQNQSNNQQQVQQQQGQNTTNQNQSQLISQDNQRKQSIVPSESSNGTSTAVNSGNPKDTHEYTKVLLLGSGESGKSTILQQLKILHSNGFTQQELFEFKPFIFGNILLSAKDLIEAYKKFDYKLIDDDLINESDFDIILNSNTPIDPNKSFDKNLAIKITALWNNESTSLLIKNHRQDFYLMDSAKYFFENLDRISQEDYLPTITDVLRTRKKTSGIFDLKFELNGLKIHIYDVGGQRSERKKWIYCFDNVTSIIFCVALSEYDQTLLEEKSQNRLEESLTLFDSVVNSRWFSRCSIVLFLNKIDVFMEKLPYSPLENYFPDYSGGNDANKAAKYILWKFTRVNRSGLPIYPYITQATDTNNIKLVFVVVRESILSNILHDTGLL
ncbi:Guanine nucleotide-binding protein G(o) subunit alpha [Wickerhamomyces ciferrii]|uniref:Guanine nucleotide-binding protein alpha-2 subunit n=1 Tax=Wickerhamomyces ciferrii (strain ATCC 14091 / BCRC 22168 / CBS 111 / JCM 3599 / NBRC 0793 / NRRL Y-1031 F-60-10) TaxID=1206466 RepID=K0KH28_WICCF|nr:Guanine nucleotide-binding protein G(o) subunit alpha [Wickerhamomyces ciferrii]CCH42271.1 Guanine nucleotide-binding protein G(o) subunit alpha [Wickerhamomyces ciferrii]